MTSVHFLLELDVPLDDRLVDPDGRREKPDGPELVPPVDLLNPGEALADLATRVRLDLPNDRRYRVLWRDHHHQVNVVHVDAELLTLDVRVVLLNLAQSLCEKVLEVPFEDPLPVLGNLHEVVLVVVRPMGAQPNLHAPIISENRPSLANPAFGWGGFHPRAYARGPQPRT